MAKLSIVKTMVAAAIIAASAVCSAHTDANDANENLPQTAELMDVVNVPDANLTEGYVSGDAFNSSFNEFFKNYVDEKGLVNYPKLRRFRLELNSLCSSLENIKPEVYITWSKKEKIAFWLNAYNICTLKGIVDNYPIKPSRFMLLFYPADSIMHIQGLRTEKYFMIMGIQYTLQEIEKDILLARFNEPRACFAVSYGTLSGAVLRNEPYIGKVLEKQLNEQVEKIINNPQKFKIDDRQNIVSVSPVFEMYDWRKQAFIKRYLSNKLFRQYDEFDNAVLNFVKDYISKTNAQNLTKKRYAIEFVKYNWQLNEQPK